MTKPVPGIKFPFFIADQYPVVEGFRCVEILIPDTVENMALLAGLLKLPGRSFNWKGADQAKRYALAESWRLAYDATDWEQCMNCEELQDCIAPLLEAQAQLFQQMLNESKNGDPNPIGQPLPAETTRSNLTEGSNPDCNYDISWAQAQQIVEYADSSIRFALAQAESATNDVELLEVMSALPGFDELGVDAIVGYIDFFLEGITDNYNAQASTEYKEQLACAIFCKMQDCALTIDRLRQVLHSRLDAHFADFPVAFSTITDLFAYLIDQDIDGTIIADVMMYIVFEGGALANTFLGGVGIKPLEKLLKLAVNDANNDWETLCDPCPTGIEVQIWSQPDNLAGPHRYTINVELGEPFIISGFNRTGVPPFEAPPYEFALSFAGTYRVHWELLNGGFSTTNPGEICWSYTDVDNVNQFEVSPAHNAGEMPQDIVVRSDAMLDGWWFMNNGEPFEVMITLTAP